MSKGDSVEIGKLIEAYRGYYMARHSAKPDLKAQDALWWAWQYVEDAVKTNSEGILEILVALVDATDDPLELAYLGAGPLEDLVNMHGHHHVNGIVFFAKRDPRFRKALASAWLDDTVPKVIADQISEVLQTTPPPMR